MWQKEILTIIIVLFILSSFGQNNKEENNDITDPFLNNRNQQSFSIEAIAISYNYVHRFNPKLNLGFRVQAGVGYKLALKQNHYFNRMHSIDLFKMQIIYRYSIANRFYFDFGPIGSVGYNGEDGELSYGFDLSTYYLIKNIHIGFRLENTWRIFNSSNEYFGFSIVPIVVGINF